MPFKTRQKKESARERRFAYTEAASELTYNSKIKPGQELKEPTKTGKPSNSVFSEDFFFVKRDLIKIVLVSSAIIFLQIIFKLIQLENLVHF